MLIPFGRLALGTVLIDTEGNRCFKAASAGSFHRQGGMNNASKTD